MLIGHIRLIIVPIDADASDSFSCEFRTIAKTVGSPATEKEMELVPSPVAVAYAIVPPDGIPEIADGKSSATIDAALPVFALIASAISLNSEANEV